MPETRSVPGSILGWCVVVLLLGGLASWSSAQADSPPDALPPDVLGAEAPLSDEHILQIDQYVSAWAQRLADTSQPQQLREARTRLIQPLTGSDTGPAALEALSILTVEALRPLLEANSPASPGIRMNALIVAANIPISDVAELCVMGLESRTAATRYWAAKAVTQLSGMSGIDGGAVFDEGRQALLVEVLEEAMGRETTEAALEQMVAALEALGSPAVDATLLDVLAERAPLHRERIRPALRADRIAMDRLLGSLDQRREAGEDVSQPLRQLARIAAHYAQIVATALRDDTVPDLLDQACVATMRSVQEVFTLALEHFDSEFEPGPSLREPAEAEDFDLLYVNVLEWVGTSDAPGVLTESGVNIPYEELQVPGLDPQAAEGPAPAGPTRAG